MRNLFFGIVVLLLASSCGPDQEREMRTYIILNESNSNVTLLLSLNNINGFNTSVELNANDTFRGDRLEQGNLTMEPDSRAPVQSLSADEIKIIFGGERLLFYDVDQSNEDPIFSDPVNRNPFRHGNYEDIGNGEFVYTITEVDFDAATPCDGPCE